MHLFGGHIVYTIEEKQWIKISLTSYFQSHLFSNKQEQKNLDLLCDFPLEGTHFYCETLDLTHPFPSSYNVIDYDPEFCWNHWLTLKFQQIGMRIWCIVLLQGVAISKPINISSNFSQIGIFSFIYYLLYIFYSKYLFIN